jgi:hypothetical protein
LRPKKQTLHAVHARRLIAPSGFELDICPEYPINQRIIPRESAKPAMQHSGKPELARLFKAIGRAGWQGRPGKQCAEAFSRGRFKPI